MYPMRFARQTKAVSRIEEVNRCLSYLTHRCGRRDVFIYSQGIYANVNVTNQPEFALCPSSSFYKQLLHYRHMAQWTKVLVKIQLVRLIGQCIKFMHSGSMRGTGAKRWQLIVQNLFLLPVVIPCETEGIILIYLICLCNGISTDYGSFNAEI